MTFRRRTILLAACAVASAIIVASAVVYIVTRDELHGQIDASLREKLTPGQPLAVQILTRVRSHAKAAAGIAGTASAGTHEQRQAGKVIAGGTVRTGPHEVVTWERRSLPAGAGAALKGLATAAGPLPNPSAVDRLVLPSPRLGGPTGFVQLYRPGGKVLRSSGTSLPITRAA